MKSRPIAIVSSWLTASLLCLGTASTAVAQEDEFLGIFIGDKILGQGSCEIVAADILFSRRWGRTRTFEFNAIGSATSEVLGELYAGARNDARDAGFNAVINFEVQFSQSTDFVYESGTNWSSGGEDYDAEAVVIGVVYGDMVKAECNPSS